MPAYADLSHQAVTGVTPPQVSEAIIRDAWPSVTANSAAASLARRCYGTVILAPIGFLVLAPVYFAKLLALIPGLSGMAVRYRLTNRRLMLCSGMRPVPVEGKVVSLADIRDVRYTADDNSPFFVAGTLDILGEGGKVLLSLPGVPEPESYRQLILQSVEAWGPMLRQ